MHVCFRKLTGEVKMKHFKMIGGLLTAAILFAAPSFADESSFKETSKFLQSGGEYYNYISGGQIKLQLNSLPEIANALKEIQNPKCKAAAAGIAQVIPVLMDSGIMKFDAFGASSYRQGDLFSNRTVYYSKDAKNSGYIWNFIQRENRSFSILNQAPFNSVVLVQFRFDFGKFYDFLKISFQKQNCKDALDFLAMIEEEAKKEGEPLPDVFASLGEEFTLILAHSPENGNPMIPFEFAFILETRNNFIFRKLKDDAIKNQTFQVKDNKIFVNVGFFMLELSETPKSIIVKTSGFRFADGMTVKSLAENPVFARYAKGLPEQGIGISYVAPNFMAPLANSPFLQGNPSVAELTKTPGNLTILTMNDNGYVSYAMSDVSLIPNILSIVPGLIRAADAANTPPPAPAPVPAPNAN